MQEMLLGGAGASETQKRFDQNVKTPTFCVGYPVGTFKTTDSFGEFSIIVVCVHLDCTCT